MPLMLAAALIPIAIFGVVFGACAIATAPPRPLPLPRPRKPWNDVATARVAVSSHLRWMAETTRDEAKARARKLAEEVRRLRARNAALSKALAETRAAAEALAELKLPTAIELVAAYHARRAAGGEGEAETGAIGGMLTLTPRA